MNKYVYSKDNKFTKEDLLKSVDLINLFSNELQQSDPEAIQKLLLNFGIDTLDMTNYPDCQVTIRMGKPNEFLLPSISIKYYDECDQMNSYFKVPLNHDSTLKSFRGMICEEYDYQKWQGKVDCPWTNMKTNVSSLIESDTLSFLYMEGVEENREKKETYDDMKKNIFLKLSYELFRQEEAFHDISDEQYQSIQKLNVLELEQENNFSMEQMKKLFKLSLPPRHVEILEKMEKKCYEQKQIWIPKNKDTFRILYNSPEDFNNLLPTSSLSEFEIVTLQERIRWRTHLNGMQELDRDPALERIEIDGHENEQFLKYVYAQLELYRKNVCNRGEKEPVPIIDTDTKEHLRTFLLDQNINSEEKIIYLKLTVISKQKLKFTMEENMKYLKHL